MIELDIKIRAKNDENLKFLIEAMTDSLSCANAMNHVDVQFSASTDGDTMTLIRKEIRMPGPEPVVRTTIEDFISKSDLSIRPVHILMGIIYQGENRIDGAKPFKYAEDITEQRFLRCIHAGKKSWEEVEAELKRQNIKY